MPLENSSDKPEPEIKENKRKGYGITVSALIFATGAAGLIYQVAWQKYLSRLLGSDTMATAIILAVFLGGLAVGYRLMGALSAHIKNQFRAYALLEAGIGLWGLGFALFFTWVYQITVSWSLEPPFFLLGQGILLTIILIGPPTICMGGTVPILTRGLSRNLGEATRVHAFVYALNTAGAFVGTLAAGFWLIYAFGLPATIRIAAALNLLAAAYFAFYRMPTTISEPTANAKTKTDPPPPNDNPTVTGYSTGFSPLRLSLIAFLSGFSLMTMENVLIRIVNLSLGSSSYSFSMIVAAFILAIALGSFVVGFMKRLSRKALFLNQATVALLLLGLYFTLDTWPYYAYLLKGTSQLTSTGFWVHNIKAFSLLTLLLILPVSFMGASIPIMFHEMKRSLQEVGRHSGRLLSWNTVGNLLGSLIGGIVLYYFLDNGRVFLTAVLATSLGAFLASKPLSLFFRIPAAIILLAVVCSIVVRPGYDHTRFAMGTFREQIYMGQDFTSPAAFYRFYYSPYNIKFYNDGIAGTVSVIETRHAWKNEVRNRAIMVNGKSDSATVMDIQTLRLSAHIPALLAHERKKTLVIGLGTGVTAGELTLYSDVERIDVAEISPSVIKALRWFHPFIHGLTHDPRVKIHLGDAFRILARSKDKWDIIISEPSNPWVVGVDQLFTKDFYALVRQKLNDQGLLLQWMHLYEADEKILGMVFNTLLSEFPYCRVFLSQSNDLLIVASLDALDHHAVERVRISLDNNPKVQNSLKEINIGSPEALLLREIWNSIPGEERFHSFGIQTLDHPRLHYMAGKSFFLRESVNSNFLLNSETAGRGNNYLLAKSTEWTEFPKLPENLDVLGAAVAGDRYMPSTLPLARALDLRVRLGRTLEQGYEFAEIHSPTLRRILLIMDMKDKQSYLDANPEVKSNMELVQELIREKQATRNWINPYPLDGLMELLEDCKNGQGEEAVFCKSELDRLQKTSLIIMP